MLGLVQELLPPIADINSRLSHQVAPGSDENGQANVDGGSTTMQHYAVVESDHPYKPAAVSNFKVILMYSLCGLFTYCLITFYIQCAISRNGFIDSS